VSSLTIRTITVGITSRFRRFARFGAVGLSGVLVNELALAASLAAGVPEVASVILATQASTTWNFLLVEHWAFRGQAPRRRTSHRVVMFFAVNNAALLLRGPIILGLSHGLGMPLLLANLVSLAVLVMLRFALADSLIWGEVASEAIVPEPDCPPGAVTTNAVPVQSFLAPAQPEGVVDGTPDLGHRLPRSER